MIDYLTIEQAYKNIKAEVPTTPLEYNERLSKKFGANIYLKREDLNKVRSYKIRGAYNLMQSLTQDERNKGVVCASAGNHAQGFAFACSKLKIKGVVYMPEITPKQKINKVAFFGGEYVEIRLIGNTFDESAAAAKYYSAERGCIFVHPFDDERTIAGQGTIAVEICEQLPDVECVICPVGGGGVISGISCYLKTKGLDAKILGVEPALADKTVKALAAGKPLTLDTIDTFVDGAAVKTIGSLNFEYIQKYVDQVEVVDNGHLCGEIIDLYQFEGVVCEPAGALSVAALEKYKDQIQGLNVICIVSGGNNDITRYNEILEKSLLYRGLKKYLIVSFPQKPGELRRFLDTVLGPTDDIVRFEYLKKNNRESGPALVGLEFQKSSDFESLIFKIQSANLSFIDVTNDQLLFQFLI